MLSLTSFHIFPVYDIPDQIRRRVETRATAGTLSQLSELVSRLGNDAMSDHNYSMLMSDMCKFSSMPDGYEVPVINISDKDNEVQAFNKTSKIYAFTAELTSSSPSQYTSIEHSYIISGYTSEVEPTLTGRMPDDMVLYISDIHGLVSVYERTATGGMQLTQQRAADNYVLANALETATGSGLHNNMELLVNPASLAAQGAMHKSMSLDRDEEIGNSGDVIMAPSLPSRSLGAQTYNSSVIRPEGLVGSIAESYMSYQMNKDLDDSSLTGRLFNSPTVAVQEYAITNRLVNTFSKHPLVAAMTAGLRGNAPSAELRSTKFENSGKFRLGDLTASISNPHDLERQIIDSVLQSRRTRTQLGTDDSTDEWVGRNQYSTRGSLIAFDIAMRVGAIMASNTIGTAQFVYDSCDCDQFQKAKFHILPESIGSLSRAGVPRTKAQRFDRMLNEMMYLVTEQGRVPVTVVVKAVLGSVTRVEIRVDGDSWEKYTHASFMMSRLHIGITNDNRYVNSLSHDIGQLYGAINEGYNDYVRRSNLSEIGSYLPSGLDTTHTLPTTTDSSDSIF